MPNTQIPLLSGIITVIWHDWLFGMTGATTTIVGTKDLRVQGPYLIKCQLCCGAAIDEAVGPISKVSFFKEAQ